MAEPLKIKRTPEGLLDHLCYTMEQLRMSKIDTESAKTQASLAKQANNVFKHELDKARLIKKLEIELPPYV